jgi:hypothetical protein
MNKTKIVFFGGKMQEVILAPLQQLLKPNVLREKTVQCDRHWRISATGFVLFCDHVELLTMFNPLEDEPSVCTCTPSPLSAGWATYE